MELAAHQAFRPFVPALLCGLALGGCLTGKSTIGLLDGTDDSNATSDTSSGGEASSGSSTTVDEEFDEGSGNASEPSSGGEPPTACPPESECTLPLVCGEDGIECDGVLARANEDGCPRQPCSDSGECPAGSSCFLPYSWGLCGPHACYDNEDTGACECSFGLDCNNDGLCVPDEEGLPPDTNATDACGQNMDATACEGSSLPAELGSCYWYEGFQIAQDAACEEEVAVGRCVFSKPADAPSPLPPCPGNESLTPMAFVDDGAVLVLFVDPQHKPTAIDSDFDIDSYGWFDCDQPEVGEACACACG
jgi:hypothetical protein